jgi:hypothetical protein
MEGNRLTTAIRSRLYRFADRVARPFSDSRRRGFILDMLFGLIASGHVHLTAIARGGSWGAANIHAIEKRLSRHLSSKRWDMSPLADQLLACSAALVTADTLLVADTTDLSKPYARHLEGLGLVHDGSDPYGRITPGYCLFEAFVRVGRWQLFPLVVEPLRVYAGAATSENAEILAHMLRCHEATGKQGTWILDRGFDRRELFGPLVRHQVAFVARQRGDRHVQTDRGQMFTVDELVARQQCPQPRRWPDGGVALALEVKLPEVGDEPFLLVMGWKVPQSERPLVLLVSPAARRAGRTARGYARAYLRRWGVEDANRGIKQRFRVELFLIRSWRAIRRLLWLTAWAFGWLNLWGEQHFDRLRDALIKHPWRLPKRVTSVFSWIALMLQKLLHPNPRITYDTG